MQKIYIVVHFIERMRKQQMKAAQVVLSRIPDTLSLFKSGNP
jgi:hypothetical protein